MPTFARTSDRFIEAAGDPSSEPAGQIFALGDRFWQGIAPGRETTDAPESNATTYSIEVGQSFYGTISDSADEDWIAVDLVAGQTYTFRMLGFGSNFLSDAYLSLFSSTGVELVSNDDGFPDGGGFGYGAHVRDSVITFTATESGTYYLQANAYSTQVGGYLLTAAEYNPDGMVFTADEIAWQLLNNGEAFFGAGEALGFNVGVDNSLTVNISALTAEGQYLAREALKAWSAVTNITFVETTATAEITFDDNQSGAYAQPLTSGGYITSSSVNIGLDWLSYFGTTLNSYSFETYIHEIGHALGLAHGGNYNGSANYGTDNFYLNDGLAWSIMSYMQAENDEFDFGGASDWNTYLDASFRYMMTPMIADIIAIQYLYGVSAEFTGNTTWGFNGNTGLTALDTAVQQGALMAMTVYDTGGVDTLDFSGTNQAQIISLLAESMSSVLGGRNNLSIARGVTIEKAIGGKGADTLIGNSVGNLLDGGKGADHMTGGLGNDTYVVDNVGDVVVELDGQGTDTVRSSITYSLAGQFLENLTLTGAANINATGNGKANILVGNKGNNILDGGQGADHMTGGLGDDTYVVDNVGDVIVELAGQGTDTVRSSITFVLTDTTLENVTLTGVANIDATGNSKVNILVGNNGANILDGKGGADHMTGGLGDDTYVIDNVGDVIVELAGEGTDTVRSSITFALTDTTLENLVLTGGANLNATGNSKVNAITGNTGNNVIDGRGGADVLTGGGGVDTFLFTATSHSTLAASDQITDLSNGDFIDLSQIDADTTMGGVQHFTLVGAFSNMAGQVMLSYDAGTNTTSLLADTNGDGVGDMRVLINGDHDHHTNFIFGGG